MRSLLVKRTSQLSFETRFPTFHQHTGGKWLIHGTKHHKINQLQSLEHLCAIFHFSIKFDIKGSGDDILKEGPEAEVM